jgi:hypothetical protein
MGHSTVLGENRHSDATGRCQGGRWSRLRLSSFSGSQQFSFPKLTMINFGNTAKTAKMVLPSFKLSIGNEYGFNRENVFTSVKQRILRVPASYHFLHRCNMWGTLILPRTWDKYPTMTWITRTVRSVRYVATLPFGLFEISTGFRIPGMEDELTCS